VETLTAPTTRKVHVFAVPDPLPRAYVVDGARHEESLDDTFETLLTPAFDARREVILSPAPAATGAPGSSGEAQVTRDAGDRLTVRTRLQAPGFVVLTDTFAPGWRATIDGHPAELQRANGIFRALAVEAGTHEIELRYRPRGLTVGLLTSAGALAGLALLLSREARRGR
jgi:hypothetical protein